MNDGVAMLIERMKTNPEEFVGVGKWRLLIDAHIDYLDSEDQEKLKEGLRVINQQRFTEKVMEELIDPKESSVRQLGRIMKKQREAETLTTQLHIDAHNRALGQTPIAGVTQTL